MYFSSFVVSKAGVVASGAAGFGVSTGFVGAGAGFAGSSPVGCTGALSGAVDGCSGAGCVWLSFTTCGA